MKGKIKRAKRLLRKEKGNMALKSVESQNVEFKSNWRDEYLKVISAFANTDGGKLMIGIDDKGKPIGLKNAKKLLEDVPNKTWGRGTIKMTNECKKAKLPEPEFKEEFGGFSVCFYKDIYTEEKLRKIGLNERQIKAVMYAKEKGRITNKEYQGIAGVKERLATIELNDLVNKNVLQKIGVTGRGTHYAAIKTQKAHERRNKDAKEK